MEQAELEKLLLKHFGLLSERRFQSVEDLKKMSSRELLQLAASIEDVLLPSFIQMLKKGENTGLFEKLMGEHELENKGLVDSFFERYMRMVMEPKSEEFNPLLAYMAPDYFGDLAFVSSRESFFKAQSMQHITEFLKEHFENIPAFHPLETDKAWDWFWFRLMGPRQ